ncbi:MAG: RNA-binding S4 domain-containing protein [Synergistaceae bacterium]|nr:RNA-binding S4 domain-containing protein [Synergistaceae bacterium]
MRMDKFLKMSRLIRRRTVAREITSVGAVRINGRQCKPASEVRTGDVVDIAYPYRVLTLEVLCAEEGALKRISPDDAYRIIEERRVEPTEKPW